MGITLSKLNLENFHLTNSTIMRVAQNLLAFSALPLELLLFLKKLFPSSLSIDQQDMNYTLMLACVEKASKPVIPFLCSYTSL